MKNGGAYATCRCHICVSKALAHIAQSLPEATYGEVLFQNICEQNGFYNLTGFIHIVTAPRPLKM